MAYVHRILPGQLHHIDALQSIHKRGVPYDVISRRSFKRFIQHEQGALFVLEVLVGEHWLCVGYGILLYRKGSQLARLYSLVIDPSWQQQGLGSALLEYAEQQARHQHRVFLRLEVSIREEAVLDFCRQRNYVLLRLKPAYYQDLSDAWVLQKQLHFFDTACVPRVVPLLTQTTGFTCGPACLLMALAYYNLPCAEPGHEELEIWREATTIFMTSGHGGCGPHGLAGAAIKRFLQAEVWVSQAGPVMLESVRSQEKREVMARIQKHDIKKLKLAKVPMFQAAYSLERLRSDLAEGKLVLALISMYQFDRTKSPHWVLITSVDDYFVYINDPDDDLLPWQTTTERQYMPVPLARFMRAFSYGTSKLRAAVVVYYKKDT
ncbi:ribosomal-protein-alanine acetyltransferase [Aliidiomarina taiwanensis]|uniref:Ribosomal-protein-alanine acetyltransferase n=1 Tax=Aliidiomarina taiwanensis TaxID=946228 RepID=A0A432X1K9_9GAMM|nr:peptidase C39 family protein [Aliidiomarina taiwanensis]RUO40461.1 ribosomal-protein-alanine acetyltransferase [Aliidiomarina taiwanensis]